MLQKVKFTICKCYVLLNLKHSLLGLWVTHSFLREYPLHGNTITLWQSCSENFREFSRKASVTDITFNISWELWRFLGYLFYTTPTNRCFRLNDFSITHAQLGWRSAVTTKWFWMFDGKTVVDTIGGYNNLSSITSGWV